MITKNTDEPKKRSHRRNAALISRAMFPTQLKTIGAILLAVLQIGCATTYQPRTTSTAKIRAKGDREGLYHWDKLSLMAIDDEPTTMSVRGGKFQTVDAGKRTFIVRYLGNRRVLGPNLQTPPVPLDAELLPHHEYEVAGLYSEFSASLWVRDISSGDAAGPKTLAPLHPPETTALDYIPALSIINMRH